MSRYMSGGVEPSLEEMLDDPVVQAVMERDGVTDETVRWALSQARGSDDAAPSGSEESGSAK